MKIIKSLNHLKNKFTKPKFFVNDYDKECLNTVIQFYNQTEKGFAMTFENYQMLIVLIFKYELINIKLENQLRKKEGLEPTNFKLIHVREKIINLISTNDNKKHLSDVLIESNTAKSNSYLNQKEIDLETLRVEDIEEPNEFIKAMFTTSEDENKIIDFINSITTTVINNESFKNK